MRWSQKDAQQNSLKISGLGVTILIFFVQIQKCKEAAQTQLFKWKEYIFAIYFSFR